MMGHRTKLKSGDEWDAFTGWRRVLNWKPGERKSIKKKFNKRVRRENRMLVKNEAGLIDSQMIEDYMWDEWDEDIVCWRRNSS